MNLDELRDVLHEQAASVVDDRVALRAESAVRRAGQIRRRQAALVVAAVAIVLPFVTSALLGVAPWSRSSAPDPAREREDHTGPALVESFAGRRLIDSASVRGRTSLTLTVETAAPSQWTAACFGVPPTYILHLSLDEVVAEPEPCTWGPTRDPGPGFHLPAGRATPHTLRLWLTDAGGRPVEAEPGLVLQGGVYAVPDPVVEVARTPVYELETFEGRTWAYTRHTESSPGAAVVRSTYDVGSRPALLQLVTDGSPGAKLRLTIDGQRREARLFHLGDSTVYGVLAPGRHTVTLRLVGDVPPDALLGVVWRHEQP